MSSLTPAISDANDNSQNQLKVTSVQQHRSSGLYDFPTPPTEFPELILCPVQPSNYPAENRHSHATSTSSSEPPPYLSNGLQFRESSKTGGTNGLLKLKRISKSTTSLPIPLSGHYYTDDHLLSSNYSFLGPAIQENNKQTSMQPRATKSYHNLKADEESPPLNQSFFSLTSRGRGMDAGGEPMPEIADLLSPINNSSIESEMEKSSGTITLVSHVYGQRSTASSGENHHRRDGSLGDVITAEQPLTCMPMPSDGAMPSNQPIKRFSMANLGVQRNNRNSAVVSGTLITAADMGFTTGLTEQRPHSSCGKRHSKLIRQKKKPIPKGNSRRRSFAHFKAHNQHPSDAANVTSDSWTRAVNWSQRISSQGMAHQRDSQTGSSGNSAAIDQYKIYDIYEESVWHSAQTPQQKLPIDKFAADGAFTKCSIDGGSTPSRHRIGSISVGNNLSLRALRSMTSLGYPWRKNSNKLPQPPAEPDSPKQETVDMEWECVSDCSCSTSIYSEHSSDASVSISEVYVQNKAKAEKEESPKLPVRRKSRIELLVRRAGVDILRRSTSLCKVISGSSIRGPMDVDSAITESHNTLDSASPSSKLGEGTNRLFATIRLAGSKLKRSLKQKDKGDVAGPGNQADDHDGIVSAYPTDSLPGRELSSYLSLSAIYSPETHLANSGSAIAPSSTYNGGSMTEEDISVCGGESKPRQSRYMPPKQPPFLGLHRRAATVSLPTEQAPLDMSEESKEEEDEVVVSRNPFRQCPSPSVYSSIGTRPRAKQLKSPFTTLPYGAYAQISQQLKSQENSN